MNSADYKLHKLASWHQEIQIHRRGFVGPAACRPASAIKIGREKAAAKCNFVIYKISPFYYELPLTMH